MTSVDFFEKIKGFFLEPSKTFDALKDETLSEATRYYVTVAAIISAISMVLITIVDNLSGFMISGFSAGIAGAAARVTAGVIIGGMAGAIIFMLFLILIIILFIGGAILHVFVYIAGGRRGFAHTIKAIIYGSTPGLLLGWIPILGVIAGIWSLALYALGIRQLQELSTIRAIISVSMLIVISGMVMALIIIAFASDIRHPYTRSLL